MTIANRICAICSLLVTCVTADVVAQTSTPSCVVPGVEAGGSIIAGTITDRLPASQDAPMGSVTITVDRYLRGAHFPSESVTLPVDWTKGPSVGWILRPPIWHDATLQPGERLLLMLFKQNNQRALCVTDLGVQPDVLPMVERMVALDSAEGGAKITGMEAALSDNSPAVRAFAIDYLDSSGVRDPAVRQFVFQHFKAIALNPQNPRRMEALEAIKWSYDSFANGSELNYRILSFVADRMADPDPQVRSVAIQFIHSMLFGGGTNRPNPAKIQLTNRAKVLQQLKRDASGGLHEPDAEKQAAKVLQALDAQ